METENLDIFSSIKIVGDSFPLDRLIVAALQMHEWQLRYCQFKLLLLTDGAAAATL